MATRNRLSFLALLVALLIATFALFDLRIAPAGAVELDSRSVTADAPSLTRDTASEATRDVAVAMPSGFYAAPVGSGFEFRVRTQAAYSMHADESSKSADVQSVTTAGVARVSVQARRDHQALVAVTFERLAHVGAGQESATAGLPSAEPVVVRIAETGRVLGYRFPAPWSPMARNWVRGVIADAWFELPVELESKWRAPGQDATGSFVADHCVLDAVGDATRVERVKLHYESMAVSLEDVPEHELRGRGIALFSRAHGWPTRVEAATDLAMSMPGMPATLQLRGTVAVELERSYAAAIDAELARWAGPWSPASGAAEDMALHSRATERDEWRRKLAGVDLDRMSARLSEVLAAHGERSREIHDAWRELGWLMRLHPEYATELALRLATGQVDAELVELSVSALGHAGNAEAQAALMSLLDNAALGAELRRSAVQAMFQLGEPVPEVVAAIAQRARRFQSGDELGANAMLLLGAFADMSDAPTIDGRDAFDTLLGMEGHARKHGVPQLWLESLGNVRSDRVIDPVRPYLDSANVGERAAAVSALRGVTDPRATQLLLERATTDASESVRRRATELLAARGQRAALRDLAIGDVAASVRESALLGLADGLNSDAESRRVVERIARQDPVPSLRRLAREILAGD